MLTSPRRREEHGVEQTFFNAAGRIEGGKRVGKAQEVAAALHLFRLGQGAQRLAVAAGLGVNPVEYGGVGDRVSGIAANGDPPVARA